MFLNEVILYAIQQMQCFKVYTESFERCALRIRSTALVPACTQFTQRAYGLTSKQSTRGKIFQEYCESLANAATPDKCAQLHCTLLGHSAHSWCAGAEMLKTYIILLVRCAPSGAEPHDWQFPRTRAINLRAGKWDSTCTKWLARSSFNK